MDTILIVVIFGVIIGMLALMFHYAGFFHEGPSPDPKNKREGDDGTDDTVSKDNNKI